MADYQLNDAVTLRGGAQFEALANARQVSKVVLWDLGPGKPVMPKRPDVPEGKPGEPKYDLAMIEFKEVADDYARALAAFRQAKIDFEDWQKRYGGPYEIEQWSCDAQDTLQRAPGRYVISHKTRGHGHLKNHGLPPGVKPGHGQAEQERRAAEGDADLNAARRADPVFGNQEVRP